MDSLLKPSELGQHYIRTITPMLNHIRSHAGSQSLHAVVTDHLHDQGQADALVDLAGIGVEIIPKALSRMGIPEPPHPGSAGDVYCTFGGALVPMRTRECTDLWGANYDHLRALMPILHCNTGPLAALVRSHTGLRHGPSWIVS